MPGTPIHPVRVKTGQTARCRTAARAITRMAGEEEF
jgi:hypothetical protein